MSHRALAWVVPIRVPAPQKAVLWALAHCADAEGRSWPSTAWLCTATCLSERTVQAAVQGLVEGRLLEIELGGGRGRTTRYRLCLGPVGVVGETPQDARGCAAATPQEVRGNSAISPQQPRGIGGETPQVARGCTETPQQPRGKPRATPQVLHPLRAETPQELRGESESTSKVGSEGGGKTRANRAERGSRLPPDWWPDQAERSFAADLGLDVDWVGQQFRDHWHAKPGKAGVMLNWTSTWRLWCRRQVEWNAQRSGRRQPAVEPSYRRSIFDDPSPADGARGPIIDMAAEG